MQRIERALSGQSRVFRGEPACFKKVSSGLYRTYELEEGEEGFAIEKIENELVDKASSFTDSNDRFDILCEIQHRGGKTNQIDFTRDLGVALFFACGTAPNRAGEPGRVIMLEDSKRTKESGISIRDVTHPLHMAAAQKSVFVSTNSGHLDGHHLPHMQIWTIDAVEKQTLLDYLRSARGIDSRSIFMDISGFIRNEHQFENAHAWLYRGKKMLSERHFTGAIESASRYIELVDSGWESNPGLYLRGLAYFMSGEHEKAFHDLKHVRKVFRRVTRRKIFGTEKHATPAYPLPPNVKSLLDKWCEKQNKIEEEIARRQSEEAKRPDPKNMILRCSWRIMPKGTPKNPVSLAFEIFTDAGYSYCQIFTSESDGIIVTFPSYFIEYNSTCWWSFYGNLHHPVIAVRKLMLEDFEIQISPKSKTSGVPCIAQVRYFAYDTKTHEMKKADSGKYVLIPTR